MILVAGATAARHKRSACGARRRGEHDACLSRPHPVRILGVVATGRGRQERPSPPPIDSTEYKNQHEAWLGEQRACLSEVLPVTGIWPIDEGETVFGSDPAATVVLPAAGVAARFERFDSPTADFSTAFSTFYSSPST